MSPLSHQGTGKGFNFIEFHTSSLSFLLCSRSPPSRHWDSSPFPASPKELPSFTPQQRGIPVTVLSPSSAISAFLLSFVEQEACLLKQLHVSLNK